MGRQIIMQPDGRFAIWSSVVDDFILRDATEKDVIIKYMDHALDGLEERVRIAISTVQAGHAERSYSQFAMTWKEACELREVVHGGEET